MDPRHSYREAAGRGASGVRLVVLLYEQLIHDLRRAMEAIEGNQIERRTHEINHALAVLGHLQITLDLKQGGKVAQNLSRFYCTLRASLAEAHARASREILNQQITYLLDLREAWMEVDRVTVQNSSTRFSKGISAALAEWNG